MNLRRAERMAGVHPDLVAVLQLAARRAPWDLLVLEGLRSVDRQKKMVAAGLSQTMNSRHLPNADGVGHAVDLAPILDLDGDGQSDDASWHWEHYNQLAPIVKAAAGELGIGIEWGGDWERFKDGPHWQLPRDAYP